MIVFVVFRDCHNFILSLRQILDKIVTLDELNGHIRSTFGFVPTVEQEQTLQTFSYFMFDRDPHVMMILRGCAGTGKTSLASAFVRTMKKLGQKVVLMAPTGRAAKVFSLNSGTEASTIHRKIYRQKGIMGGFSLDINLHRNTLFLVDEASMVANGGYAESIFGSGCLLDDLVQYVYSGDNCPFVVPAHELAFVGADGKWRLEEGDFRLSCGGLGVMAKCTETKVWETPNI